MSSWQDRLWSESQGYITLFLCQNFMLILNSESESAFAQEKLNNILQLLRENPDKMYECFRALNC